MPDYAWECNMNELAVTWKCDDMVMLSYLRIYMYFYLYSQSLIYKKLSILHIFHRKKHLKCLVKILKTNINKIINQLEVSYDSESQYILEESQLHWK